MPATPDSEESIENHAHSGPLTDRPRSREEAEARYVATRDDWVAAMRRASSGRPADLASLAIRQEAYELAAAELERWRSSPKRAIPVDPEPKRTGIEVVIGQEMAWKRVHDRNDQPKGGGLLGRLLGRGGRRKD
ncbi:MAG: hypothetical protein K5924_08950 [Chloroflexi bacterium]|nr:hypothetical protein [Chloroflexota bacterium]